MGYQQVDKLNKMDFSLTGGVLIIGSLIWDTDKQRVDWRNNFLQVKKQIPVVAPIRYGRISKDRKCTFSMVFSNDCNETLFKGAGIFVPFKDNPINLEKIKTHSQELIKSERKLAKLENNNNNWGWGALTICLNPEILNGNSKKSEHAKLLLYYWNEKYSNGFNPEEYKVGNEFPILSKQGVLKFNWTEELNEYDFIIATATKPNIEIYPTAKIIAERMITNEYTEYFNKNLAFGISTFQDKEIASHLK